MNDEKRTNAERMRLIAEIDQAFPARPLPERITDCDPDCPECNAITAEFYGQQWQVIDDAKIEANKSMSFFSPKAFHYLLPAYLRYSLRHFAFNSDNSDVCEFMVYALTPDLGASTEPSRAAWMRERFSLLDRKQAEIVVGFLTLISRDEELRDFHYDIDEIIGSLKGLLRELKVLD